MVSLAHDASTEIERKARAFCTDLANRVRRLPRPKGGPDLTAIQIGVSGLRISREARSPWQQADYVSRNWSWVCWSAHMSDKARHVYFKLPGRRPTHPKDVLGDQYPAFRTLWAQALARHGLVNFAGVDGWSEKDWHHVELPKSRISRTHPRAQACLEEYVRMTRLEGRSRNLKFENQYWKELQPHLQRLPAPAPKSSEQKAPEPRKSPAPPSSPPPTSSGPEMPPLS